MLYEKNKQPFSQETFANPTAEYRGTPFWAWNCVLDREELLRQIDCLRDMGFGGFHMHVRTGMATPYLSDDYMQLIRACIDKAEASQMLAWLYDEDRWPSGAAGGLVTRDPAFRSRHLLFTPAPYAESQGLSGSGDSTARAGRSGNGRLLACYDIVLDESGCLKSGKMIGDNDLPDGSRWYAYLETALPNPWYNNQTYVDTLSPKAIQAFIQTTHERYLETCGDTFGRSVPAIFTDEPQFAHKTMLSRPSDRTDVVLPWTDDLPQTFTAAYGQDLMAALPELIWNLPAAQVSQIRYQYHDHIAERFASAFADQVGSWCRRHNLMLTGHMMEEPTLKSQTAALGEAMRSYRSFDLPGIDMLCDRREWTTARQAQSASRQFGCPGVLSELYGVTNWDFDFRGHKLQGDWQAALGVTVRVPHLSWVSMAGEAKRDYPASINYQVPWHREYPLIEDHFARVNTVMTRGQAICRVGVIHPVESYWLHWGPQEQTAQIRQTLDQHFSQVTEWLLRGQIDFDYISESLLPQQCPQASAPLAVGKMRYDIVVVPDLLMLRKTTVQRLQQFQQSGGRIIFMCDCPNLADGRPDNLAARVYDRAERITFCETALLDALAPVREIDIRAADGSRSGRFVSQLRQEGSERWLFIAQADTPRNQDLSGSAAIQVRLRGDWQIREMDSLTGEIHAVAAGLGNGWTVFDRLMHNHDSLLLWLQPKPAGQEQSPEISMVAGALPPVRCFMPSVLSFSDVPVLLSEPNVCLLDMAEYALDDQPLRPVEEILRADNILRSESGWPTRKKAVAQPWTIPAEAIEHRVKLRFTVTSRCRLSGCRLAVEAADQAVIKLNGQVASQISGWYVDKAIPTIDLPDIIAGDNRIELDLPFGRRTDLEWCYLLGDFAVHVAGTRQTLAEPVRRLAFSDVTKQGLPFYGGNITYLVKIRTRGGPVLVHVPQYRGALIAATLDGQRVGTIVFSPYTLELPSCAAGEHLLELTLFGNRVNTFGPLHNNDRSLTWIGPDAWRTTGDAWNYAWQIKETGILRAPDLSGASWISD